MAVDSTGATAEALLGQMTRAAFDPLGWAGASSIGRCVGVIGFDVPREVLIAAELHPVQLRGCVAEGSLEGLEPMALDPVAASHVASFLRGDYAALDYLVVSHDRSMNAKLFFVLRELARLGDLPDRPRLAFVDLRHMPRPTTEAYNRRRVRQFAEIVGRWRGGIPTDGDLRRAIDQTNRTRSLLQSFDAARRSPEAPFSSADALAVLGAAQVMEPTAFQAALVPLVDAVPTRPQHQGRRIYLSGSTPEDLRPYQTLDSLGALVVGEDHDVGLRRQAVPIDPGDDPLHALAGAYGSPPPVAEWGPLGARARHAVDAARGAGAAVIELVYRHDRALGWEWPLMRQELLAGGVEGCRWLIPWPGEPTQAVTDALASFVGRSRSA